MTKYVYILGIVLIIVALGFFLVPAKQSNNDLIHVTFPRSNDLVSSPLTVQGEARGNWYFEASFPVKLLDANGNVIAQTPAQAQGEWMTTDFVPFLAILEFAKPLTETAIFFF